MRDNAVIIAKWLFVALAIFGVAGVAPIAFQQWSGDTACPSLGFIPACYIAFLGYSLTAISAFLKDKVRLLVFLIGFTPIFALAARLQFRIARPDGLPKKRRGYTNVLLFVGACH